MTDLDLRKFNNIAKKYNEDSMPLYLSYPVEAFWKSSLDNEILAEKIKRVESPCLYIHFPYCKTACYYCCCNKYTTNSEEVKDRYIDYIGRELELKSSILGVDALKVKKMHWGGGTPTYMNQAQLYKLFNLISKKINIDTGAGGSFKIEAYPDEEMVNREKLKLLRQLGFNKISFGIQDFDSRVQRTINRDCKKEAVRRLIETSKELGFDVHIDLCYGLPFQGLNELERTLEEIILMEPGRIVMYPYINFPALYSLQKLIPSMSIPNSFIKALLIKTAEEILEARGYARVGYDSFVKGGSYFHEDMKNGRLIRDFMGTSTEGEKNVLGIGSSSISAVGNLYFQNITDMDKYFAAIDNGVMPLAENRMHLGTKDDQIRRTLIQKSILCDFRIDKKQISEEFSIDFEQYFHTEMNQLVYLERDGLVRGVDGDIIALTKEGTYFARHVAHIFDVYYSKRVLGSEPLTKKASL